MRRWLKRIGLGLLTLVLIAVIGIAIVTATTKLPGEEMTPAGYRQARSLYVSMPDGVQLAVTVWLPPLLQKGERVPVLMRTTRYWRAPELGWAIRALVGLHLLRPGNLVDKQTSYFNKRRFAVIVVDARGSGASGGSRPVEYSPREVADMGEVATWVAAQPWSNGHVGTYGASYDGNMAELAAVPNHAAIRAVMPLYDDFDSQALIQPGGVPLQGFVQEWSKLVAALDRNDVCALEDVHGWKCWQERQLVRGVLPVDDDPGGRLLAEQVKAHRNVNVAQSLRGIEFRDDPIATPEGRLHFSDISPYGFRKQIEASGVPMMGWCGWLDANSCEGVLIRYRTFSNPQVVVVGPLSHGGEFNIDPFAKSHTPPVPAVDEQLKVQADFFDRALRNEPPEKIESSVRYYTMGEGAWHTTVVWPPEG
ncbi:MAG TPA: CocE/NonD family hydrolase, partial [Thermoanaerobaculia bacterium]